MYMALKHTHMLMAYLSIALFLVRGVLMLVDSGWLRKTFFRIFPHVVDTLLLVSAIALLFIVQQYPLVDHWLTAKVAGLIAYIALGVVALKRGRTFGIRLGAFIGAIVVFGYIYSVALSRHPLPFLAG